MKPLIVFAAVLALTACAKQPSAAAVKLRDKSLECLESLGIQTCTSLIYLAPALKVENGIGSTCKVSADRLATAAYRVGSQTSAELESPHREGSPLHRLLLERDRRLLALRESLATFEKECPT
jgi:hypothetical protein